MQIMTTIMNTTVSMKNMKSISTKNVNIVKRITVKFPGQKEPNVNYTDFANGTKILLRLVKKMPLVELDSEFAVLRSTCSNRSESITNVVNTTMVMTSSDKSSNSSINTMI